MSGLQDDRRRHPDPHGLPPPPSTHAPPVARIEAGEPKLRPGRAEVIAQALGVLQEGHRHLGADGVTALVILVSTAEAVSVPPGQRGRGAKLKGGSEHIFLISVMRS